MRPGALIDCPFAVSVRPLHRRPNDGRTIGVRYRHLVVVRTSAVVVTGWVDGDHPWARRWRTIQSAIIIGPDDGVT